MSVQIDDRFGAVVGMVRHALVFVLQVQDKSPDAPLPSWFNQIVSFVVVQVVGKVLRLAVVATKIKEVEVVEKVCPSQKGCRMKDEGSGISSMKLSVRKVLAIRAMTK